MILARNLLYPITVLSLVVLSQVFTLAANGRDNGQWSDQPPQVRQWFQKLMQPDDRLKSCCGEADAYEADNFEAEGDHYVAVITNGAGDDYGKRAIPNGTKIPVPNHKMKWDEGNPTGHGILFLGVSTNEVYCYIVPGGV